MKKFVKFLILILPISPKAIKNEESCRLIKNHFGNRSFSFKPVSKNFIISAIKKLPSRKASIPFQ